MAGKQGTTSTLTDVPDEDDCAGVVEPRMFSYTEKDALDREIGQDEGTGVSYQLLKMRVQHMSSLRAMEADSEKELRAQKMLMSNLQDELKFTEMTQDRVKKEIGSEEDTYKEVTRLVGKFHEKSEEIKKMKERNAATNEQIQKMKEDVISETKKQKQLGRGKSVSMKEVGKRLERSQQKLKLVTEAFDKQTAANRSLREKLQVLQWDQHEFVRLYTTLNTELDKASRRISELLEKCQEAFENCDDIQIKKGIMKERTEQSRAMMAVQVQQQKRRLDTEGKFQKFILQKNRPIQVEQQHRKSLLMIDQPMAADQVRHILLQNTRSKEDNLTVLDYEMLQYELYELSGVQEFKSVMQKFKMLLDSADNKVKEVNEESDTIKRREIEIQTLDEEAAEVARQRAARTRDLFQTLDDQQSVADNLVQEIQTAEKDLQDSSEVLKGAYTLIANLAESVTPNMLKDVVGHHNISAVLAQIQLRAETLFLLHKWLSNAGSTDEEQMMMTRPSILGPSAAAERGGSKDNDKVVIRLPGFDEKGLPDDEVAVKTEFQFEPFNTIDEIKAKVVQEKEVEYMDLAYAQQELALRGAATKHRNEAFLKDENLVEAGQEGNMHVRSRWQSGAAFLIKNNLEK